MNYEEKYNEILEWARKNKARLNGVPIEEVLPELAESEDERIREKMIEHFKAKTKDTWCNMPVKSILAWLEKQKEQKPAEWSEEDEIMLKGCIRSIEEARDKRYPNECDANISYNREINWLKSLRPSWRPSEEHLSALLAIFNDPNNIGSQTCQLALTDLYEQIKKL